MLTYTIFDISGAIKHNLTEHEEKAMEKKLQEKKMLAEVGEVLKRMPQKIMRNIQRAERRMEGASRAGPSQPNATSREEDSDESD